MKTKLFTLLLAVVVSVGMLFASNTSVNGIWYDFDSSTKTAIVTYRGSSYSSYSNEYTGTVVIPASVTYNNVTYNITSIGSYAFSGCSGLTSVVIPNSVTSIGSYAFYSCTGLTSMTIPNSVTSIESYAFLDCTGLTSVTIPNSVTSIGSSAFYRCTGLTSVTIGNGVTSIGEEAFEGCTGLTSVTIPNSVTSIGSDAFYGCSSLTSVTIPNSVTSIGSYAFCECRGMASITIGNSVTSIGSFAFMNCTNLTSVTIPNSVTSISEYAFGSCSGMTSITCKAIAPPTCRNNVFDNVDKSIPLYVPVQSLSLYQAANSWKDFENILPDSTEVINYATLADIYNMAADSVFILGAFDVMYVPDNQSSNMYIKDSTGSCMIYKANYGLQAGDHVEAGLIGKVSIYHGLYEIIPITAKEGLTVTPGEAPAPMIATEVPSLSNVSQYVIYEGVSFSADAAFVENKKTTINGSWNGQPITFYNQYYIGATLSAEMTYNITAVNSVYGTNPQAYPLAVTPCVFASDTCGAQGDNLTWTINCDILTISGTGAMANFVQGGAPWGPNIEFIKSVLIEEGITSIGNYAFENCFDLTSIEIPNSVDTIGDGAFFGCSGLTSVTIPDSVNSIGSSAFYRCSGLTSVTIGNSVTSIGDYAFFKCSGLTSVTIPNSVTSIGSSAFEGCRGLTSVTIPNSVTSIGYRAFFGCSINTINFKGSIEDWCNKAWSPSSISSNYHLQLNGVIQENINIPNSVTSIGYYAFSGCSGLTSVTIPNSVTSIGDLAFDWCTGLTSLTIPDSVTSIGEYAFSNCTGLTTPIYNAHIFAFMPTSYAGAYTIPDGIESIVRGAFGGCTGLTSVTIPNSVTSIGNEAFLNCTGLTSVTIPNSVTSIGDYAFLNVANIIYFGTATGSPWGARSVNGYVDGYLVYSDDARTTLLACSASAQGEIIIPNSVTSIEELAFWGCTGLTSVTIPNSVISIGDDAFFDVLNIVYSGEATGSPWGARYINGYGDGYLLYSDDTKTTLIACSTSAKGDIEIPNGVDSIGNDAFWGCTGLTSITIPNSVRSIGDYAFDDCTGLTTPIYNAHIFAFMPTSYAGAYTIPDGIESIVRGAFGGCTGLTSVTIPNSVTSIGDYAFLNVANIIYFGTATGSPWGARSVNGYVDGYLVYYDDTKKTLLACFSDVQGELIIPNSVTSIWSGAFYGCSGLTTITIPNSVTDIGDYAFSGCSGLTSVTIPNKVSRIGDGAFSECRGLTSVEIPNSVYLIGDGVFSGCTGLTSLIYNANVFVYMPTFYSGVYTIPYGIKTIAGGAFDGCSNLTSVTIPNSVTSIGTYAFSDCISLTSVTIPNSVTNIEWGAFSGCSGLRSITIPNSVEWIDYYAFFGCSGLTSLIIPNSVTGIGGGAFNGCTGLTSIEIPNSVTSIGNYAFEGCSGLTSITIGDSGTRNGNNAPRERIGLTSVTVPDRGTSIGSGAFRTCSRLTSVTISDNFTSIGDSAFFNCSSLTSVWIPNSIDSIGLRAFYNCSGLTAITCDALNPPALSPDVFYAVRKSIPLYVPAESLNDYTSADQWRDFENILPIGSQDIEEILSDHIPSTKATKILHNGQIFILRGEKVYTLQGQEVK